MTRLTKSVRQKILQQNEGFTTRTSYKGKNCRDERKYTISGGVLKVRSVGKTSWADSRFDKEWIASDKEAHRFLYNYQSVLNLDGIANERVITENRKKEIRQSVSTAKRKTYKSEGKGLANDKISYSNENAHTTGTNYNVLVEAVVSALLVEVVSYGINKATPYIENWALKLYMNMKNKVTGKAEEEAEK